LATIYDVAKAAQVSPKTVSRVLNADAPVSKETRTAVEAAIDRLGYVPSTAARTMRSNRSGLIGLITGAISAAPYATEMRGLPDLYIVQGIQRVIAKANRTLLISDTGGDVARAPHLVRTFMEHRVEGLIYVAEHHLVVELPKLPDTVSVVLANCFDERGATAIVPDDAEGQRALVREIAARGHTRIAYLTLPPDYVATKLRLDGYRRALDQAGLPFDPELVGCGEPVADVTSAETMWTEVARFLALAEPPTVICCGNDRMAMRLYGLLRAHGLRVPEDISVAGYDDYRMIAETLYPPLTSVELAYHRIGERAAARLLEMLDDKHIPAAEPERVAGPVVWRDSVTSRNAARP